MSRSSAVLILTHGRADRVVTVDTLLRCGYTGRVFIVIDDEDDQADEYRERYGDDVVQFNKRDAWLETDSFNNTEERRSITYARNASFAIAADLGLTHFVQLDDDYTDFHHRVDGSNNYLSSCAVRDLDAVFDAMFDFLDATPASCVALAQGGDLLAGAESPYLSKLGRKAMNSFFCRTDRPVRFLGLFNEDVNTYVTLGSRGELFFTVGQVHLNQVQTQESEGGISELYLETGTYTKAFSTVMTAPSSVKVAMMGSTRPRLHHAVDWNRAVPMIVSEDQRRSG